MLEERIAKKLPAGRIEGKEERNFFSSFLFVGGGGRGEEWVVVVKYKFQELTFSNFPSKSEEMYEKPLKKVLRILRKVVPPLLLTRMQDRYTLIILLHSSALCWFFWHIFINSISENITSNLKLDWFKLSLAQFIFFANCNVYKIELAHDSFGLYFVKLLGSMKKLFLKFIILLSSAVPTDLC